MIMGGRVNVEKEAFFFALPTCLPGKQPGDEFHVALPPPPPTGCVQGEIFGGLVMDKITRYDGNFKGMFSNRFVSKSVPKYKSH